MVHKIIHDKFGKYIYLSETKRMQFEDKTSLYAKVHLQEKRIIDRKITFLFKRKILKEYKWVDLSYCYEHQFRNNIQGLINYLERESVRAWGDTN